jgi:hypothetical protein
MDLYPHEIIKKEILPRKSFFFNMTERLRIIFLLFYLAVSCFFIVNIFDVGFSVFSFITIIVFCSAIYITFFRWIIKYFNLKNTCYVITNLRIIIARKGSGKIVKFKMLGEIEQVNVEMNNTFFGNIIFGEPENIFGKNNEPFLLFKNRVMNFKEDQYAFISVEHIIEVIPVFEELGLKVNKTFY